VRAAGEDLGVTLPGPGTFELRIESLRFPALVPATVRLQVVSPQARQVRLRLEPSPHDAALREGGYVRFVREGTFSTRSLPVRRRAGSWEAPPLRLEPGSYTVEWSRGYLHRRRTVLAVSEAGDYRAVFGGSEVRFELDWLPANGRDYEVVLEHAHGVTPPRSGYGTVGDVPPGPAVLHLRTAPTQYGVPSSDAPRVWTEIYRESVVVPSQGELVVHWSMPRLFAGQPPVPGPWTSLPGIGSNAPTADPPPREEPAFAFAVRDSAALYVGARVHTYDGRWSTLAPDDALRRGTSANLRVDGHGTEVPRGAVMAIGALRRDAFAWVEGGEFVSFRTPAGLSQELLPIHDLQRPMPCYATGIAALSEQDVVVVGRCRGLAPEWDRGQPHEGFVAVRDATRWTLRPERPAPLRAAATDGSVVVAVGDRGTVLWRQGGVWTAQRRGDDDLVGVAMAAGRVIARTAGGDLLEIPVANGTAFQRLPRFVDETVPRAASDQCITPRGVAVLYPQWRRPNEGGRGPHEQPSRVTLYDGRQHRVLHDGTGGEVIALACEGQTVWLLVRDGAGAVRVERR
jgi:hypothetical protein